MEFGQLDWYSATRVVHIGCAVLSFSGFCIRAILKLKEAAYLKKRWIRIAPHCIDTLLLISAVILAMASHQYPIQNNWLTAKVIALLVYIAMGMIVMRLGKNKTQQVLALFIALLAGGYIFQVALHKNTIVF